MDESTPKSSRFDYVVEPFQEDFTGRLSWHVLGCKILASAGMHADSLGFGMKQLFPRHYAWVLSRIIIEMNEIPCTGCDYSIETWIRCIYRTFTDRCFAIYDTNGKLYGYAYTVWALINTETHQPVNLEQLPGRGFLEWADADKICEVTPFSRLRIKADKSVRTFAAQYSDIDINNHVNSIRYIEHILDLFPKENYREHPVSRIELAYHEEAYAYEPLSFYKEQVDEHTFDVEIRKNAHLPAHCMTSSMNKGGVSVCACRVTFK